MKTIRRLISTTLFDPPDSRLVWVIYAIAMAAISALFFADLRHLLLGVDDAGTFRDHSAITKDFLFLFSPEKERASGRIVDEFVMWVTHLVWGNNLAVFHMLIVFVHTLASFSLAVCFRRLGFEMATSLIGALLFLINISHVETVHWISALEYPMAVLVSAWTLYFFARFVESERRIFLGFFYAGLLLCILTHFVAVLIWPFCLFYAWLKKNNFRSIVRDLIIALPAVALALVFVFAITGTTTTTQSAFDSYSQSSSQIYSLLRFAVDSVQAFLWLLGRLVFMAHWLPLTPSNQHPIELWLGAVVLLILLCLLWKGDINARLCSAWVLLYLIPFIPATLVHTGIARYVYLATAGSSLLLAWALGWLGRKLGRGGPYALMLALLLVIASSYNAEGLAANIARYNSGRYYITNDDPHIGIELLRETIEIDAELLPFGEVYLYLIEGLLITGQEYEDTLQRALREVAEDSNIQLLAQISNLLADGTDYATDPEILHRLNDSYHGAEDSFLHTVSIFCQHVGNWYSQHDDSGGAIRSYRLSLSADPRNLNTTRSLLKIQLKQGLYGDAVGSAEILSNYQADNPQVLYLVALSYKYAGRPEEALATVHRAQKIEPSANLHILEGDLFFDKDRLQEAEKAYRRAIAASSESPEPYLQLAHIYRTQGQVDSALKVLDEVPSALQQKYPIIQNSLGSIYYAEGRAKDAIDAYQKALAFDPKYALVHYNLATVLRSLGRLNEAEQAYKNAIESQPENPLFYGGLGRLYVAMDHTEAAMAAFAEAIERSSTDVAIYLLLGQFYVERGQRAEALTTYDVLMQQPRPIARADHYAAIGANLHVLGQPERALVAYRRALELDPNNAPTHTNLGWLLSAQGRYGEAIEHYSVALANAPNATAQFNMGLAHMALGDFAAAHRVYALGVARFGAEEAQRIGAVDDLRALLAKSASAEEIRRLLNEFWPQ